MSCGEHIYKMLSTNDRDSFKSSVTRENRVNKDYKYTFRYSGLNVLITKTEAV